MDSIDGRNYNDRLPQCEGRDASSQINCKYFLALLAAGVLLIGNI